MSDKTKISGQVTLSDGVTSAPAKPLTGTDIDHIPTYGDASGTAISMLGRVSHATEDVTVTASLTAEAISLNKGINGNGAAGNSSRLTGELAFDFEKGPISSAYIWGTQKNIDIDGQPDIDLDSLGFYLASQEIGLADDMNLMLGAGARIGSFDPEILQATAKLSKGSMFTEAGYVQSLGDQNDQVFAGLGYDDEGLSAHIRQYLDVSGDAPSNNRTQLSARKVLSDSTSIYSYGTLSQSDELKLQEAMIGVSHQLSENTSMFAEGGVTRGVDPKDDLQQSAKVGITVKF